MTSIQCLLTSNWSSDPWSYLKRDAMAIVTAKVASVEDRDELDRFLFGARDEHDDDCSDRRDENRECQCPRVEQIHRDESPSLT